MMQCVRGMRGQGALTALRRVDGETGTARAYLQGATEVTLAGVAVVVDCDGALYWPDEGVLAIADLHLEKGSSFAARGVPLPPYDTAATLARLVMPAFGAFAGGLNVRDRAFADVFGMLGFTVYMLGEGRTYVLAAKACLAD